MSTGGCLWCGCCHPAGVWDSSLLASCFPALIQYADPNVNEGLINDLAGAEPGCSSRLSLSHWVLPPELLAQLCHTLGTSRARVKEENIKSFKFCSEGCSSDDLEVIHPFSGNVDLAEVIEGLKTKPSSPLTENCPQKPAKKLMITTLSKLKKTLAALDCSVEAKLKEI